MKYLLFFKQNSIELFAFNLLMVSCLKASLEGRLYAHHYCTRRKSAKKNREFKKSEFASFLNILL